MSTTTPSSPGPVPGPVPGEPAPSPATPGPLAASTSATDTDVCGDPHDHTGHDHPPTGAEIVTGLIRGFSILTLLIPVLGLVMLIGALAATPSTPLVLLVGIVLGGLQLGVLLATGLLVTRLGRRLALNPSLLVGRAVMDEVLRLAAVLLTLVMWPAELRGPLGLWVGVGCALVWVILTTAQLASARQRIASPSAWSQEMVATLLSERISVRRSMVMRVLDVVGMMLFQIGATILVTAAPIMIVATTVLAIGTGMSTLVLGRRAPADRTRSAWAFAPLGIGLLSCVLAVLASVSL